MAIPPGSAKFPQGWSLPLRLDSTGRLGTAGLRSVSDVVRQVVEVAPSERPLLPEFGCRIHLLESLRTDHERTVAAALVEEALDRWVPWLGIETVQVTESTKQSCVLRLYRLGEWHEMELTLRQPEEAGGSGAGQHASAGSEESV